VPKSDFSNEEMIAGRNAVAEALKSGRECECMLIAKGSNAGSISKLIRLCKDRRIPVKEVPRQKLDMKMPGVNHQGVALVASAAKYAELDDIFRVAEEKGESPFILVLDEIEDAHNLGAILRTAEAAGVHGVIIPKRRGVGLNYVTAKVSCGAVEYVPVVRVSNLPSVIDELKLRGVWIYGADMDGERWCDTDFSGAVALVIGSEGRGIGRLVREKCDIIVSLPMFGKINSLNASVAASVLTYEVVRQRINGLKGDGANGR
jgi:23S rRNA (guanosine2251-2'-O)-methyltransferase